MALELGHEWVDWERERLRAFSAEARRWVAPLLLGLALAGLALVALRGNILQMRYQLDASYRQESLLTKEYSTLAARYWVLLTGPLAGLATGVLVGAFTWVARRFLGPSSADAS